MLCILLLSSLVAAAADSQPSAPAWVSNEFRMLKSDVQAQLEKLDFILGRIDNSLIRLSSSPSRIQTNYQQYDKPKGSYPRDCVEALNSGVARRDSWTLIDPDGPGRPIKPFAVRCEWRGETVSTEFGFSDSYWMKLMNGPRDCIDYKELGVPGVSDYCPSTKTKIDYVLSLDEMRAAVHVSGNCSQRVDWNCLASSMLYLDAPGAKTVAYGKNLERFEYFSQGVCDCGKNNSCIQSGFLCNCATNAPAGWHQDQIVLTDKQRLPITDFTFGDLARSRTRAQVYVSNVVCETHP